MTRALVEAPARKPQTAARAVLRHAHSEPAVSSPADPAEREAEAVADRFLAGLPLALAAPQPPSTAIQRQEAADAPRREDEQEPREEELQASRASGPALAPAGFSDRMARAGSGHAIPAVPARTFERVFGASFADVRVHRDAAAHGLAASISAEALTHGRHIYFSANAPGLDCTRGMRLLAHELTHVRQQAAGVAPSRVVHRSRALYISTIGTQGFLQGAERFHRDRGFPAAVHVASVEQLLEHLVTLPRPVESVRLVTHAVPAGIFLPLLRGGATSLFEADLALQTQTALESELATEHVTQRTGPGEDPAVFEVTESAHHVVPREWVADAYRRVNAIPAQAAALRASGYPRDITAGGDLETLIWWILDRQLVLAQRPGPAGRRGRAQPRFVVGGIPARARAAIAASLERNIAIYRGRALEHLLLRGSRQGTTIERLARAGAGAAAFERQLLTIAGPLIEGRFSELATAGFATPQARYRSVQGALERGTFANNVLFAKVAMANQAPFEIRGCRIGQNVSWLERFRDFWGLGAGPTRKRPHVSAPDLRDVFWVIGGRSMEWLEAPPAAGGRRRQRPRRIYYGTPEYDAHIVHVR